MGSAPRGGGEYTGTETGFVYGPATRSLSLGFLYPSEAPRNGLQAGSNLSPSARAADLRAVSKVANLSTSGAASETSRALASCTPS